MKLENNKIVYELQNCIRCNGTGKSIEHLECPNNNKKMKGKHCEHCGTKNRYHHYIKGQLISCPSCKGKGKIMENRCSMASDNIMEYLTNNISFKMKNDLRLIEKCESHDGEGGFIMACYSPKQQFGCTDYKDHRNDTLETLKELIKKCLNHNYQATHLINDDNTLKNTMLCTGYNGGYFGELV